ncbi:MAG: tripartite tricarboxylate transporter substrate binding protein [Betaproteobacteria bacterium]|nr:tripartite tricarboxylate transporter substrate binding protein [Betaproteobacteria bacterium]
MRALQKIILAASLAAIALPDIAHAQHKFPSKPIRLATGTPAGSQTDTIARMLGQKMSERWGQPVVVENRPGAGGLLAANVVAKATPDGHTLWFTLNFSILAALQPNLPFDPFKDFVGVSQVGYVTQTLFVAPALGIKSIKDLVALAHAQPGKIIYSTGGAGSLSHLNGARFRLAAETKVVNVAFKAGVDAVIETLAGRTHYGFASLAPALPFIKDGKLLALAVTTPQRSPVLPDVPAMAETFAEFKRPESSAGLLAPAHTPRPIRSQIGNEVARILDLPDVKERLQAFGFAPAPSTPEEYDMIRREQIATLSRVVRDAGLRSN